MRKTSIFIALALMLASCTLSKKAATTGNVASGNVVSSNVTSSNVASEQQTSTTATTVAAKPDSTVLAKELIDRTIAAQPTFETLNMSKFDLQVQFGTARYTLRGSMRINRDSLISISLMPMLGIEVIRIEFMEDYFTIYDKMNHRYCETPYDAIHIATGLPVDFRIIQSIASAQFFSIPHREDNSFCQAEPTDSTYTLVGKDQLNRMYQYFEVYQKYPLLAHAGMKQGSEKSTPNSLAASSNAPFMVSYGNYGTVDRKNKNLLFPYHITIDIDHRLFHFVADVNVEKTTINEPIVTTPVNREKYTRVPFNQILSLGQ